MRMCSYKKLIFYDFIKHKNDEKNFPTHYLERAKVVFAFNIPRYYLYGVHVYIFTYLKIL